MREAYSISEFEWLVVEVNALWRRKHRALKQKSKRIPFFCRLCNENMVDKSELAWHRQKDLCVLYDRKKDGPLKMFPVNGAKGNSEIAAVFRTYNMKLPWQNGGTGGERPEDEPSVGEVDPEDVVNLSDGDSSGDSAFASHPPMKKARYGKSVRETLDDIKRAKAEAAKDGTRTGKKKRNAGSGIDGSPKRTTPTKASPKTRPAAGYRSMAGTPSSRTQGQSSRTFPAGTRPPEPLDSMPPPPLGPRVELEQQLKTAALAKFPDCRMAGEPKKPGKPPGLYSLIDQTGDVIDLDLLTSLEKSREAVLTLHANGTLGRKIFNAWGAFSMDPAIRVSFTALWHFFFFFIRFRFFPLSISTTNIDFSFSDLTSLMSACCPRRPPHASL